MTTVIDPKALSLIEQFRAQVPLLRTTDLVYLDQTRSAPVVDMVTEAIVEHLGKVAAAPYAASVFEANSTEARKLAAAYFNAEEESFAFTRDSTESSLLFASTFPLEKGDNIILLDNEFPNLKDFWVNYCTERGIDVKIAKTPLPFHCATAADFEPLVDDKTKLAVLSSSRFDTGYKNDVKGVASALRAKGVQVLADFCQDAALNKVDLAELNVSAAVFSCYKGFCLPPGLGGLYIDPSLKESLRAVFAKDKHKNTIYENLEHYSNPHMHVAGFIRILNYYNEIGLDNIELYLRHLGNRLLEGLKEAGVPIPEANGASSSHVYVLQIKNPEWKKFLYDEGIIVTQYNDMRISVGLFNNEADIDKIIKAFKKGLKEGLPLNKEDSVSHIAQMIAKGLKV